MNNLLLSPQQQPVGATARGVPQPAMGQPSPTGSPGAQGAPPAALPIIGPSIIELLGEPKLLSMDDLMKAIAADISAPVLGSTDRAAMVSSSIAFIGNVRQQIENLRDPAAPRQAVDHIIRSSLYALGMSLQQAQAHMQAEQPPMHPSAVPPEQVEAAHKHLDTVLHGLLTLTSKPKGRITRRDLHQAASLMLTSGAFSHQAGRAHLMGELARAPADEPSIRAMLGHYLGRIGETRQRIERTFGPRGVRRG